MLIRTVGRPDPGLLIGSHEVDVNPACGVRAQAAEQPSRPADTAFVVTGIIPAAMDIDDELDIAAEFLRAFDYEVTPPQKKPPEPAPAKAWRPEAPALQPPPLPGKERLKVGGRNIDVVEVEAAVASHPGVAQACVVPLPDPELGERIGGLGGRGRAGSPRGRPPRAGRPGARSSWSGPATSTTQPATAAAGR